MAVIKCKMCGGDLNIVEGESVCECEYCGTRQTIPSADSEKKLTLFARANRLRLASEFDKAFGIYENIVAEFPEEAEAYWGLVLCKYGIEYVDDPATGKKIPTCHRSSFDSVMEDEDFEQVMENSDPISRKVYREEAKQIEEIRKGILEVSGKEEPYDIFICYKETDENGDRTLDSVLAQDLYDVLTDKGYRVFFARITLEDKLGQEYEPYIFAALNSAKIMLAVGTDYEYYNAVWVKNEWSRYLKLMVKDKNKHLIPCYKNLDAYDIPKEFAKLQAQDLGKVGATQDLLRGIEKLLGVDAVVQEGHREQVNIISNEVASMEALLRRADMFLEDEAWDSAKDYFNRVLDADPECAEAYLGLAFAESKFPSFEDVIQNGKMEFYNSKLVQRAQRFCGEGLSKRILDAKENTAIVRNNLNKAILAKELAQKQKEAEEKQKQCEKLLHQLEIIGGRMAIGGRHIAAVCQNGTVAVTGSVGYVPYTVRYWKNIIAIKTSSSHIVGLDAGGHLLAVGDNSKGQCNVMQWDNIAFVEVRDGFTLAVKKDGTILVAGDFPWNPKILGGWKDINEISIGNNHIVGITKYGTVVADGSNAYNQCDVKQWHNVVSACAGNGYTVAAFKDGHAEVKGDNLSGACDVTNWENVIKVCAGDNYTIGLKGNGTVAIAGIDVATRFDPNEWHHLVDIYTMGSCSLGLRTDGSICTAGIDQTMRSEILNWRLFSSVAEIIQMREEFDISNDRKMQGLCPYCGGTFKGVLTKRCTRCGKVKDY